MLLGKRPEIGKVDAPCLEYLTKHSQVSCDLPVVEVRSGCLINFQSSTTLNSNATTA
jgi:hypothetical protein